MTVMHSTELFVDAPCNTYSDTYMLLIPMMKTTMQLLQFIIFWMVRIPKATDIHHALIFHDNTGVHRDPRLTIDTISELIIPYMTNTLFIQNCRTIVGLS